MKQLTYQPRTANQNEPGYRSTVTGKKLTKLDRLVILTKLHPGLAAYMLYELGVKPDDVSDYYLKREILANIRFE